MQRLATRTQALFRNYAVSQRKTNILKYAKTIPDELFAKLYVDGREDDVIKLYDLMKKSNMLQYTTDIVHDILITAHGAKGDLQSAAQIFEQQVQSKGMQAASSAVTNMLEAFVKNGKLNEAEDMFNVLVQRGMVPTRPMFRCLIDAYSHFQQPEECKRWMQRMQEYMPLDEIVYGSLLWAYAKTQNMSESEKTSNILSCFHDMQVAKIEQKPFTYTALITHFTKCGHLSMAEQLFEHVVDKFVQSKDSFPFNVLMGGYAKQGNVSQVIALMERMKHYNVPLCVVSVTTLIRAHVEAKRLDKAEQILTNMKQDYGITPDAVPFNILMLAHVKQQNVEHAEQLFQRMLQEQIPRDVHTYRILMNRYSEKGNVEKVEYLAKLMKQDGLL